MRTLLLAFALLISFDLESQIPDSLDITLPWPVIHTNDCNAKIGTAPTTNKDGIFISSPEIILESFDTNTGECYKKILEYTILDWPSEITYDFTQVIKVNEQYTVDCASDITITADLLPYQFSASDLIQNIKPGHTYSFDPNDVSDNNISFNQNTAYGNYEVFVYNHDDLSVCNVNVYLTDCIDVTIDVPETVTLEFNEEPFIPLSLDLLDYNIEYPCGDYTLDLYRKGNGSKRTIFPSSIGKQIELTLDIQFTTGTKISQTIDLLVTGTPPPPIPMFIEEKEFLAGETVEFDIWSDQLDNLIAWQFRLNFDNAAIKEITEGPPFHDIPHNIFNEDKTINSIWTSLDAMPIDVPANETWLTLTVTPEIDGNTFDIFNTTNDPWSSIIIEEDEFLLEYEADFIFNVAPRNILSSNEQTKLPEIRLVQNPVSDVLLIEGFGSLTSDASISINTFNGMLIENRVISNNQDRFSINTSDFASGLYIATIVNREDVKTLKFVVK